MHKRGLAACALIATTINAPTAVADSDALVGIHFWGDRNDATPAQLLDSANRGGWDLEIVNTGNPEWNDVDVVQPLYQTIHGTHKVTPITRLGYYWGNTLPAPGTPEYTNWPAYIGNNVVNRLKGQAHLWQLGNEPNLLGEATNWPERRIQPVDYAAVYRNVRTAIRDPSLVGAAGAHKLLVAPVSPGGVAGERWMDGRDWLEQALAAIPAAEVDGVALHAYGGGGSAAEALTEFRRSLAEQIAIVDAKGLSGVPVYLTEWNRRSTLDSATQEAITAQFAREALRFVDEWNRRPGNHNVVATTWFVYDGGNGTGTWDAYSIEYWKTHGNAQGTAGDLYTAFEQAARAGYKAGLSGTRPLPTGIQILDDFEGSTGRGNDGRFGFGPQGSQNSGLSGGFDVVTADDSFTKAYSQKIGVTDNTADPNGWYFRYKSGAAAAPSENTPITLTAGPDGRVGFFLKVLSVRDPITGQNLDPGNLLLETQIVVDSGPTGGGNNSDAGVRRRILADGQWHFYEWDLDDPADWTSWFLTSSDGRLGTNGDFLGRVSIDSIMFYGPNVNVEYFLDGVMHNTSGSLSAMGVPAVPEPSAMIIPMLAGALLSRRRALLPRRRRVS